MSATNDRTTDAFPKVLFVDDDPDYRAMLSFRLKQWGYDVEAVEDPEAACEHLLRSDEPQCVLLDQQMPSMTGLDVCRTVRAGSRVPHQIMMLTASDSRDVLLTALRDGADDLITKTASPDELRERLLRAVELLARTAATRTTPADFWSDAAGESSGGTVALALPRLNPETMRYESPIPAPLLERWAEDGRADEVLLDRLLACPDCSAVPTFRMGCGACGSGRVARERWLHHFACAWMGPVHQFRDGEQLVCPKCHTRGLVVGADFDEQPGQYVCLDCGERAGQLVLIGHCTACQLRFPAEAASIEELRGHYVRRTAPDRLGTLADDAAPRPTALRPARPAGV